jgi:hypothetical protein
MSGSVATTTNRRWRESIPQRPAHVLADTPDVLEQDSEHGTHPKVADYLTRSVVTMPAHAATSGPDCRPATAGVISRGNSHVSRQARVAAPAGRQVPLAVIVRQVDGVADRLVLQVEHALQADDYVHRLKTHPVSCEL